VGALRDLEALGCLVRVSSVEGFESVVRPKVHGAFVLDQVTREDPPTSSSTCPRSRWCSRRRGRATTRRRTLPTRDGPAVLDAALRSPRHRLFVGEVNYDSDLVQALCGFDVTLDGPVRDRIDEAVALYREKHEAAVERTREHLAAAPVQLTGRPGEDYTETEIAVARCWADALGYIALDVDADLLRARRRLHHGDFVPVLSLMGIDGRWPPTAASSC